MQKKEHKKPTHNQTNQFNDVSVNNQFHDCAQEEKRGSFGDTLISNRLN